MSEKIIVSNLKFSDNLINKFSYSGTFQIEGSQASKHKLFNALTQDCNFRLEISNGVLEI